MEPTKEEEPKMLFKMVNISGVNYGVIPKDEFTLEEVERAYLVKWTPSPNKVTL